MSNIHAPCPAPSLLSLDSNQSMDPPRHFRTGTSYTRLMMKDHVTCSVCKKVLMEPVSIPCGHSFCKTCIRSYWTNPVHGKYPCPQCGKRFKTQPALYPNLALAKVVQTLKSEWFCSSCSKWNLTLDDGYSS